jgi:hypothetical protein
MILSPASISSTWSPHPYGQLFSMVIDMDMMKRQTSNINNDNYWEQFGNMREKNEEGERGDFVWFGRGKAFGHYYTCYTIQKNQITSLHT